MAVKSFDPATGLTTYDDGSTYQAPVNYGTAANPSWGLNTAQINSTFGDQGVARNEQLGISNQAAPAWQQGGGVGNSPGTPYQQFAGGPMPMGGGGGGGGGSSLSGSNPYLQPYGQYITDQMTNNFARRVMPSIASGAMASGAFGGSRQGVVEANAMNDLNQQIGGALANLGAQNYQADRSYDLGLRGNDLGFAGLDAQIAQNNFNNQMTGAQFGQGIWNQNMANNQTGINAGTNIQNTPRDYWSQFANQYNSIGQGYGSTTGSSNQSGNPIMGALGGAQLGSRLGSMWGSSPNAAGGSNSQGWGTGSGYGNQDYGSYF